MKTPPFSPSYLKTPTKSLQTLSTHNPTYNLPKTSKKSLNSPQNSLPTSQTPKKPTTYKGNSLEKLKKTSPKPHPTNSPSFKAPHNTTPPSPNSSLSHKTSHRPQKPHLMKKWSINEDSLLLKYQTRLGNHWKQIASLIPQRTPSQCSQRFRRRFKPKRIRIPWTPYEDSLLKDLIKKEGVNWQRISDLMGGIKSGKQIRDRFINVLDKGIIKTSWSEREDMLLIKYYREIGAKWAKIAKFLPGRPENSVKNRFHSYLKNSPLFLTPFNEDLIKTERKNGKDTKFIWNERPPLLLKELLQKSSSSSEEENKEKISNKENNNPLNSLLPHDILKLRMKGSSSSSELSLTMKKSCSSESQTQLKTKGRASFNYKGFVN